MPQTYLNNHLKLVIHYHSEHSSGNNATVAAADVCRIVAFEVYPQRYSVTVVKSFSIYPHDAMLARVIVIATCPSVRLSRAGIVSKRRKLAA